MKFNNSFNLCYWYTIIIFFYNLFTDQLAVKDVISRKMKSSLIEQNGLE